MKYMCDIAEFGVRVPRIRLRGKGLLGNVAESAGSGLLYAGGFGVVDAALAEDKEKKKEIVQEEIPEEAAKNIAGSAASAVGGYGIAKVLRRGR